MVAGSVGLLAAAVVMGEPVRAHADNGYSQSFPVYHVHTGDGSGGGCYTSAQTGTEAYEEPCGGTLYYWGDQWGTSSCDRCAASYFGDRSGESCPHSETKYRDYTYYELGCGYGDHEQVGTVTYHVNTLDWAKSVEVTAVIDCPGISFSAAPYIADGYASAYASCYYNDNGYHTYSIAGDANTDTSAVQYTLNIRNIDNTAPQVNSYSLDPNGAWVRDGVRLSLDNVTDLQPDGTGGCGLHGSPYSYDNGMTWTSDPTHLYTANGTYTVKVRDMLDNCTSFNVSISTVDTEGPRINRVDRDTVQKVRYMTLTVSCDDIMSTGVPGCGLADQAYSFDGGYTWSGSPEYVVSSNGMIDFRVRDRLGNESARSIKVSNIDSTPPSMSISVSPTGWTNGSSVVIVDVTDDKPDGTSGSGLADDGISFDGGATWSYVNRHRVYDNCELNIKVKDACGNIAEQTYKVSNIDKTAPVVDISGLSTEWTNKAIFLTFNISDPQPDGSVGSGPDTTAISYTNKQSWSRVYTRTYSKNGDYSIYVRDACGNIREVPFTISNMDKEPPRIHKCEFDDTPNLKYTELVLTCDDIMSDGREGCGLNDAAYSYDDGNTWVKENRFRVTKNGVYVVYARDKLGNRINTVAVVENLDTTPPQVKVTKSTEEWTKEDVEIKLDIKDINPDDTPGSGLPDKPISYDDGNTWTDEDKIKIKDNGDIKIKVKDKNDNVTELAVEVRNIDKTAPEAPTIILEPENEWTKDKVKLTIGEIKDLQPDGSNGCGIPDKPISYGDSEHRTDETTYYYDENGHYDIYIRDKLDNIRKIEVDITNIDRTAPRITKCEYDDTRNVKYTDITIEADDILPDGREGCGLDDKPLSFDGGKTWTDDMTYRVEHNKDIEIAVRDKLGNTAHKTLHIDNIDDTPPMIIAAMSTDEWTNEPVEVRFDLKDVNPDGSEGAGFEKNSISYDEGLTWTDKKKVVMTENGSVKVIVKDKNDNRSECSLEIKNIDMTPPSFSSYTLDPESEWTKDSVKLTLGELSDIQPDGKPGSGIPNEAVSYDGGENWVSEKEYIYDINGNYEVYIRDVAGNKSKLDITVSNIDREAPRITACNYDTEPNVKSVDIKVKCDDIMADGTEGSGLADKPYSFDGGLTWTDSDIYTVNEIKALLFIVRDRLDNRTEKIIEISGLDNTPPLISAKLSPEDWTNGNVEVNFTATDKNDEGKNGIGIGEDAFSYDGGQTWTSDDHITVTENVVKGITVRDKNGNIGYMNLEISNIDTIPPEVSIKKTVLSEGKAVRLDAEAYDDLSGISERGCKWEGPENGKGDHIVIGRDGVYTLTVTDRAGNSACASINVTGIVPSIVHPVIDIIKDKIIDIITPDSEPPLPEEKPIPEEKPVIEEKPVVEEKPVADDGPFSEEQESDDDEPVINVVTDITVTEEETGTDDPPRVTPVKSTDDNDEVVNDEPKEPVKKETAEVIIPKIASKNTDVRVTDELPPENEEKGSLFDEISDRWSQLSTLEKILFVSALVLVLIGAFFLMLVSYRSVRICADTGDGNYRLLGIKCVRIKGENTLLDVPESVWNRAETTDFRFIFSILYTLVHKGEPIYINFPDERIKRTTISRKTDVAVN